MVKWSKYFCERPLAPVFLSNLEFYGENPLDCLVAFYSFDWGTLLTSGTIVFPRLVQLFYANIQLDKGKGRFSFTTIVKGTKITLDESTLCDLVGIDPPDSKIDNDFTSTFADTTRLQFTMEGHSIATQSHLKFDPHMNFAHLTRIVLPMGYSSRSCVTNKLLYLMYSLLFGCPFNFPNSC